MSTRSVITRKDGDGFKGVYHHWDGYPSGLGQTLWYLYHKKFNRDIKSMLKCLIDDHPAGWSTIVGANFSKRPGYKSYPKDTTKCETCKQPVWKHYRRYYKSHGEPEPPGTEIDILGHVPETTKYPNNPMCFCHGERHEKGNVVTEQNASGMGCEYAYVFDEFHTMWILSSYKKDGEKMIGKFGFGDPNAEWHMIAQIDLNETEPDWEKIDD